jgi:hypothetical protein
MQSTHAIHNEDATTGVLNVLTLGSLSLIDDGFRITWDQTGDATLRQFMYTMFGGGSTATGAALRGSTIRGCGG